MAARLDGAQDLLVGVRLQVLEREVFEFAANLAHAEAVRDGRVDLDGLARDALAPLGAQVAERAHVVHAVGQLHHDDADILHHGEQHLAEAFGLAVFGGKDVEFAQLGDAVDAARHFFAELLAHLFDRDAGVFDDVVQQAGLHGHQVHAHVRQDVGHHDGMDHVRLAGIAHLPFVILAGEAKGFLERGQIVLGAVFADLGFQLGVQLFRRIRQMFVGYGIGNAGGLEGHSNSIVAGGQRAGRPAFQPACPVGLTISAPRW